MIGVRSGLYNFFVAIDEHNGQEVLKRSGRKFMIITGIALLILGGLGLASVYGAFSGLPVLNVFSVLTMPGAYTISAVGFTILMLGIIRKMAGDHVFRQTKRGIQESYNKMGVKIEESTKSTILSGQVLRGDN